MEGGITMRLSAVLALCIASSACGSPPSSAGTTREASTEVSEPLAPTVPSSPVPHLPPPSTDSSSPTSAVAVPAPPAGLMMRQGTPPGDPTEKFVTSSVVMITWSDIQPTNATDPPDWSTLDNELGALARFGVEHVRLRVMSGGD